METYLEKLEERLLQKQVYLSKGEKLLAKTEANWDIALKMYKMLKEIYNSTAIPEDEKRSKSYKSKQNISETEGKHLKKLWNDCDKLGNKIDKICDRITEIKAEIMALKEGIANYKEWGTDNKEVIEKIKKSISKNKK